MNIAVRKKLIDSGADNLAIHSLRMKAIGVRNRERFAAAFVDAMEAKGDRELFRRKCADYGISPTLIFLLIGIAWDLLVIWWTNRDA